MHWITTYLLLLLYHLGSFIAGGTVQYPPLSSNTGSQQQFTGEREAIHVIGSGYNIFKGNPDGSSWSNGGDDPGVLHSRKILSVDQGDSPTQINIQRRHQCQVSNSYNLVYNGKTYQERLRQYVTESVGGQNMWTKFAFTLSSDFNAISHQTETLHYVFQDYTTLCYHGDARYRLGLAGFNKFSYSPEFSVDLCTLPSVYDANTYQLFVDRWGTHVVTEVFYGKRETKRYRVPINDYFNYLIKNVSDDVRQGGPLSGFASSLSVDMDSFQFRPEYRHLVGQPHQNISVGGTDFYDNVKLVITPLSDVLIDAFWTSVESIPSCKTKTITDLNTWNRFLNQAISEYPVDKNAVVPVEADLGMPMTWPKGTYSLQKPLSGCPGEITWAEGNRYEEPEKQSPSSGATANSHFDGFQSGYIYIDDDDTDNHNSVGGVLPDGTYNSDTTFYFCCRSDGESPVPIWLPNLKPFYMFPYRSTCQSVHGMVVTEEAINFDSEDSKNDGRVSGAYPTVLPNSPGTFSVRIFYCYYTPTNRILTGPVIGR